MPGENDLWAWLQQYGGNWVNPSGGADPTGGSPTGGEAWLQQPYGGHSMNYGPPRPGVLSALNPISSAQAAEPPPPAPDALGDSVTVNPHGNGPPRSAGDDGGFNNPYQAAAAAPVLAMMPPRTPTPPVFRWPDSSTPTGMPAPQGSPSATPKPADSGPKGPLAASGQGGIGSDARFPLKRRAGAPNLGYYQPNNRFVGIDRPNADPQNSMRSGPQGTALNLAGLFGGGQQPAVNPNVPAAAAQPVSGPIPSGPSSAAPPEDKSPGMTEISNTPWWMGPLQRGRRWNPNSNDYSP